MQPRSYNILIFGASYGSLLATKLLCAGNSVRLLCLPQEAELINAEGTRVKIPVKGRAMSPDDADPGAHDLVVLAMQEPQYRAAGPRRILQRTVEAKVPCMSIMNMPPLTFLARVPEVRPDDLDNCYTNADLWRQMDPSLITLASPDPQAFRPPDEPLNVLQVSLPTNFKVSRFESDAHTQMMRDIEEGIASVRFDTGQELVELPVKLKVHDSLYVPMAKWAMLITGNYRCFGDAAIRSIRDAVHSDLGASRQIYEWVASLCRKLGASNSDLVPFEKYAAAATGLEKPSSVARALSAGAPRIERVDRLIQLLARRHDMRSPVVDEIVARCDARLRRNQKAAA